MLQPLCPNCWEEVDGGVARCPRCHYSLVNYTKLKYEQKLILSLRHPIPENQMMAIQLLGELKSSSALPALASMLCEEKDLFVIREIALALCRIGTRESWDLIDGLRQHPSRLVRDYAHLLITESFPGIEPDRSSRGQG